MSADFYLQQLQPFVGAKIVGLARADGEHDEFFGLVVELPEKERKVIFFLRDDEGNESGSFEIQDINKAGG
jgi:hypothetical protein